MVCSDEMIVVVVDRGMELLIHGKFRSFVEWGVPCAVDALDQRCDVGVASVAENHLEEACTAFA